MNCSVFFQTWYLIEGLFPFSKNICRKKQQLHCFLLPTIDIFIGDSFIKNDSKYFCLFLSQFFWNGSKCTVQSKVIKATNVFITSHSCLHTCVRYFFFLISGFVCSNCIWNLFVSSLCVLMYQPCALPCVAHVQGCQMAYFQTKNLNLGKFGSVLQRNTLIYFMAIWSILHTIGIFLVLS
jgi:hypothetical protein